MKYLIDGFSLYLQPNNAAIPDLERYSGNCQVKRGVAVIYYWMQLEHNNIIKAITMLQEFHKSLLESNKKSARLRPYFNIMSGNIETLFTLF